MHACMYVCVDVCMDVCMDIWIEQLPQRTKGGSKCLLQKFGQNWGSISVSRSLWLDTMGCNWPTARVRFVSHCGDTSKVQLHKRTDDKNKIYHYIVGYPGYSIFRQAQMVIKLDRQKMGSYKEKRKLWPKCGIGGKPMPWVQWFHRRSLYGGLRPPSSRLAVWPKIDLRGRAGLRPVGPVKNCLEALG